MNYTGWLGGAVGRYRREGGAVGNRVGRGKDTGQEADVWVGRKKKTEEAEEEDGRSQVSTKHHNLIRGRRLFRLFVLPPRMCFSG